MPDEKTKKSVLTAVPDPPGKRKPQVEEPEVCPTCFGSGMEIVPGKGARPCHCRRNNAQPNQLDKIRIPKRYSDCDFHNYDSQTESQKWAYNLSHRLALKFPAVDRGLLFMGTVGVGKTHLAVSILKGLTERGIPCLFYELSSLLKEIQDSYNSNTHTSELRVLAPILEADVLVLDELGGSKPTDWIRDTMMHIINTRYNDKKLTIFTTNYPDERVNDKEETLEDRIGVRLRSRLFEMCKTILIEGDDFRRKKDEATRLKKANP